MLIINRENETARLIVTVSELNTELNPEYDLSIHSAYSNTSYAYRLPDNTSTHKERYDEFVVPISGFTGIQEGKYSYKITEATSNKVCEIGVLIITEGDLTTAEKVDKEYLSITADEQDDDITIYNPE